MLTDVDLPAPGLLWTRWATLAAALTGIGYADVWYVDDRGAHHDDHGGSWARMALLDGARSVVFGYDRVHSATAAADPPVDVLTGAPDWLPWDELTALAEDDRLGFVVWHSEGRWTRARYPDGLTDGLAPTIGPVLSNENTLAELAEIVTEWGQHDLPTPAERDDVREASEVLLTAAIRGAVAAPAFDRLLGRLTGRALDLPAALAAAARGGITAGTRPPRLAPGERPPMRRVRHLSQGEHDRLVWRAMHEATELDRPPAAGHRRAGRPGRLDARPRPGRRRPVQRARVRGLHSLSVQPGEAAPATRPGDQKYATFHELSELVRRLRSAEADPRYGRWLFLRVLTTGTDVEVERRYDTWPSWWADDGVSGPWRTNLQEEMAARGPMWRPGWVRLLDPEVAYRPSI